MRSRTGIKNHKAMSNLLEQFTAELNRHFFLKEFSFHKNKFRAACGSEFELADHVIALPDALFIFQLKERAKNAPSDERLVETWFRQKVLNKGSGQLADSLRFFREQPRLLVQNQREHHLDLASSLRAKAIPILLYSSGPTLPQMIDANKHHVSRRAGFVHVMHIRDYYHLCHTGALPKELIAYFEFRQNLLLRNPHRYWNEAGLTAQFIAETETRFPMKRPGVFLKLPGAT